jgi:chorismate dehydratase
MSNPSDSPASSPLGTIRLGCVPYLNARPLVYGLESHLTFLPPSQLAEELHKGALDGALVPVAEYLAHPQYKILPGMAIGSKGAVRSVYLAHAGPLANVRRVRLDPYSRTSNLLLKLILKHFFSLNVEYMLPEDDQGHSETDLGCEAELIIGDRALLERKRFQAEGFHLLDLGETWTEQTDLPFVFAFWALHPSVDAPTVHRELQKAANKGLEQRDAIASEQDLLPEAGARDYLNRCISYSFGEQELRALNLFSSLLNEHRLISSQPEFKLAIIS